MLASFCLRLAAGMLAALLLLPARQVNPRFFRTHFLTALALTAVAAVFLRDSAGGWLWLALGGGLLGAFLGSVVWSLDGAPGGLALVVVTLLFLAPALALTSPPVAEEFGLWGRAANEVTATAVLGAAMTAMLIGHSYLIAPTMSIAPLLRLLAALAAATLLRLALCGWGLWRWTEGHSLATLNEVTIWLPVRWALGFVGPLALAWMAWQTARIRSTQSATGILYVVVILCFLGELTGQLLLETTRYVL